MKNFHCVLLILFLFVLNIDFSQAQLNSNLKPSSSGGTLTTPAIPSFTVTADEEKNLIEWLGDYDIIKIYRDTATTPTTLIYTLTSGNSKLDSPLVAGTKYYYRVTGTSYNPMTSEYSPTDTCTPNVNSRINLLADWQDFTHDLRYYHSSGSSSTNPNTYSINAGWAYSGIIAGNPGGTFHSPMVQGHTYDFEIELVSGNQMDFVALEGSTNATGNQTWIAMLTVGTNVFTYTATDNYLNLIFQDRAGVGGTRVFGTIAMYENQ